MTTTTVGYGDMVPFSWLGKVLAVLVMHAGVLVLALPITVLGANFAAEVRVPYPLFHRALLSCSYPCCFATSAVERRGRRHGHG